jgi:hypothetical protein
MKGSLARAVVMIFTTISASIIAFAFFEVLADLLISKSDSGSAILPYAQPVAFILLFVIAFAVFETAVQTLLKKTVQFSPLPEKVGRVAGGAISGLIVAGALLTALDMVPIAEKFPYQRFDKNNPDPQAPAKATMNADGMVAGIFNTVSSGSFSGQRSFAVIHPSFIDEVFMNRLPANKNVSLVTTSDAIKVPNKAASWVMPENVKTDDDETIDSRAGHVLTVVRVGLKRNAAPFSLSQLRLVCNEKTNELTPLKGKAVNVWPVGYFTGTEKVKTERLASEIDLKDKEFTDGVKYMDVLFYVPETHMPALVALKQNNIDQVPAPVGPEQSPDILPF